MFTAYLLLPGKKGILKKRFFVARVGHKKKNRADEPGTKVSRQGDLEQKCK